MNLYDALSKQNRVKLLKLKAKLERQEKSQEAARRLKVKK